MHQGGDADAALRRRQRQQGGGGGGGGRSAGLQEEHRRLQLEELRQRHRQLQLQQDLQELQYQQHQLQAAHQQRQRGRPVLYLDPEMGMNMVLPDELSPDPLMQWTANNLDFDGEELSRLQEILGAPNPLSPATGGAQQRNFPVSPIPASIVERICSVVVSPK